jgi:hypothetical protein
MWAAGIGLPEFIDGARACQATAGVGAAGTYLPGQSV